MELRKFPRIPVEFSISFAGMQHVSEGTVINLSVAGCGVESAKSVPKGIRLSLQIKVPDSDSPIEVEQAEVRWSLGRRFGLQFRSVTPENLERLCRLVENSVPKSARS